MEIYYYLQGLDNVSSATLRPFNSDINTPRIDSYRFSMANLEGEFYYVENSVNSLVIILCFFLNIYYSGQSWVSLSQ